jgi:hypothetical protein
MVRVDERCRFPVKKVSDETMYSYAEHPPFFLSFSLQNKAVEDTLRVPSHVGSDHSPTPQWILETGHCHYRL